MINNLKRMISKFIGRNSEVKNTYYTELLETFDGKGCAICRLLESSVDKYLDNLLHEFTMDPVSRREIRESFGYCAKHTAQFVNVAEKTNQRLSASIVAEDLANSFLKHSRKAARGVTIRGIDTVRKNPSCPICLYYAKHEKLYISEFVKAVAKEEFINKYRKNPFTCMYHLIEISRLVKDRAMLKDILEPRIEELGSVDLDLNNFIKKFDHRSGEKITDREAVAWIKFFNMLNKK